MFTPKLNTSRTRSSPFNTPGKGSAAKSRRSVSLYGSHGRSRGPALNRSVLQTSLVSEVPLHRIEEYGTALPLLVREAIINVNQKDISVRLDPTGWARLVCSRQLYIWRFNDSYKCHELTLPPSDVSHSADLVCVLTHPTDPLTSACIVTSPEGVIRYWPAITHEAAFIEISIDLKGEEAGLLTGLQSFQCVLATTTSSLHLLLPSVSQNQISSRMLRTSGNMLSGFSRRMSSFIFGPATSQAPGASLQQVLAGEMMPDNSQSFYVLSGSTLQKISIKPGTEQVLYQCDVDQFLRPCLAKTLWNQNSDDLLNLRTWLIDMQTTRDGVVILGAGMNPDVSQEVFYAFGTLHTEGNDPPQSFLSFTVSKLKNVYQEEDSKSVVDCELLLPDPTSPSVYVYNASRVDCLSVNSSSQLMDKVDFNMPGDRLLGAGHYEGRALFFSLMHGLVTITQLQNTTMQSNDVSLTENTMLNESLALNDSVLGHVTMDNVLELSMSEDKTARLKGAFLHSCRDNLPRAIEIVEELFPSDVPLPSEPGAPLDTLVSLLSEKIVDDFPASDPRWAESVPQGGVSSSVSLILLHQLEDKLKAHEVYVSFLTNVNLWPRVHTMRVRGSVLPTRMLLCEHAEKLSSAIALRGHHTLNPQLIDRAIKKVLQLRKENEGSTGLTAQDIFYRKVSNIDDILAALFEVEQEDMVANLPPSQLVALISTVNTIFIGMLQEAWKYRQSKAAVYQPNPRGESEPHFVPWTMSPTVKGGARGVQRIGLRTMLTKQHALTVKHALNTAHDAAERGTLLQQLLEITDMLLDGYQAQLAWTRQSVGETVHHAELLVVYEKQRTELITPFMNMEQHERAASLAEKYCDFGLLVQLCETTNNDERLQRYMEQFHNKGFSDFVFKWYVEAGKRGKLMSSSLAQHPQLSRFLHQGDNVSLSWVHDINIGDFSKAHQTLMQLGYKETESLAKKKTLFSLSKLALYASNTPPPDLPSVIESINDQHDVILHQEMLPEDVVQALGFNIDNMDVQSVLQLVELYTGDLNMNANEFDFKKALDLLRYLDKEDPDLDYDGLLLSVWCKAIQRDRWDELSSENLLEQSKDTIFFKTVELAYSEGMDLREYLPNADQLLAAQDLGELRDSTNFQYLVKAGYEQIARILA